MLSSSQNTDRHKMTLSSTIQLLIASLLLCTFLPGYVHAIIKKPYIVYLGGHSHGPEPSPSDLEAATNFHYDLLSSVLGSHEKAKEAIFYSYNKHINGFAAELEQEEAAEIAKNPRVVSVFLDKPYNLHTTRSWEFLGLDKQGILPVGSAWNLGRFGEDTIIANIDTGVWPESESFNDKGIGPVPSKWRGICALDKLPGSTRNPCNRKLIGARYFYDGFQRVSGKKLNNSLHTARDHKGHGTHTLSTAGGNFVVGANVLGQGNGTAKGGSPRARVVAYKACWYEFGEAAALCQQSDSLNAFEQAISDGVDVISVSKGTDIPTPDGLLTDGISIGALHAIARGIVVVASGGNNGPKERTVTNVAPWVLTVAASSIDREITNNIAVGSKNQIIRGGSLNPKPTEKYYPTILGADAKLRNASSEDAKYCRPGTLDPAIVKGKALICSQGPTTSSIPAGTVAAQAGAKEVVFINDDTAGDTMLSEPQLISASGSNNTLKGKSISHSFSGTKIFMSGAKTYIGRNRAPQMLSFSSKGPSAIDPNIVKPDITAPGLNIIAAFPKGASLTDLATDTRQFNYTIFSGTSQSCSHVAGIVGLLKTRHPDWSPAAIKSAIMTTASTKDNTQGPILDAFGREATPYDYGAGHVQPNFAMNPGLVYDLGRVDYLNYLCASNYRNVITAFTNGEPFTCPESSKIVDLNYPSITLSFFGTNSANTTRTVTNVGSPGTYVVNARVKGNVKISVKPGSLSFTKIGEKKRFQVFVEATGVRAAENTTLFGELVWTNGRQKVRSPVVVI